MPWPRNIDNLIVNLYIIYNIVVVISNVIQIFLYNYFLFFLLRSTTRSCSEIAYTERRHTHACMKVK